jgi:hypothetical protein
MDMSLGIAQSYRGNNRLGLLEFAIGCYVNQKSNKLWIQIPVMLSNFVKQFSAPCKASAYFIVEKRCDPEPSNN